MFSRSSGPRMKAELATYPGNGVPGASQPGNIRRSIHVRVRFLQNAGPSFRPSRSLCSNCRLFTLGLYLLDEENLISWWLIKCAFRLHPPSERAEAVSMCRGRKFFVLPLSCQQHARCFAGSLSVLCYRHNSLILGSFNQDNYRRQSDH